MIYEVNQGTIIFTNIPVNGQRSKNIDIRYHFTRSEVNRGKLILKYCPTEEMIADMMKTPVSKAKLKKVKILFVHIISS